MKNVIERVEVRLFDGRKVHIPFSDRQIIQELIKLEKEDIQNEKLSAFDSSGNEEDISLSDIMEITG